MRPSQHGIKYRNETDKAYGVAGMALGLAVFDVSELSRGVDLDAAGFDTLMLPSDFFATGHLHMTAKDSWRHNYGHFQVVMGLSIANAMCRKMVLEGATVDTNLRRLLLDASCREGMTVCQLEQAEVETLFNKYFSHLQGVFANPAIAGAVASLAQAVSRERRIAGSEIADFFQDVL